jgi:hypothetical protein
LRELLPAEDPLPIGRVRREAGERKRATQHDPLLLSALPALVKPDERGDPMSPLRRTNHNSNRETGRWIVYAASMVVCVGVVTGCGVSNPDHPVVRRTACFT